MDMVKEVKRVQANDSTKIKSIRIMPIPNNAKVSRIGYPVAKPNQNDSTQ